MDPINYLGMLPQIDLGQKFLTGLQVGAGLGEIQDQAAARQLALQQKQVALQRASQYQADVSAALAAPRDQQPQLFSALALRNPDQAEPITKAWGALTADQQKSELQDAWKLASTLHADRADLALQEIDQRREALKNSGQPTSELDSLRGMVEKDPKAAYGEVLHKISFIPGGKDILANLQSISKDAREGAESDSKLAGNAADLTLKNLGIVGQTLGAMQGKGIKPEQAKAAIASLVTRGAIPKEERADWLAAVPSDPKELDAWLGTVRAGGMKPDDQLKYTTPDANAKLQAETSVKTTGMNVAGQQKVQEMITARQDSKGEAEVSLDPETLTSMAQQYLAGDKSVMQNLGRGAQGSANIVALRKEITAQAKAQGMTGPAIAAKMAEFAGTMAGQRTAGNRIANVEMAANEAESLIPLARQASSEVSRSGLLVFGKAGNLFDSQTNDPKMRQFVAANNALVNVYSRAISPSGTPTVSDKEHARELLQTAYDQKSYNAVLDQMQKEIAAARSAPQAVRKAFNGAVTGQEMEHGPAKAAPAIPTGWTVREH